MGYPGHGDLGPFPEPFAALRLRYGFVPALFRAQSALPRVLEAGVALIEAAMAPRLLSRLEKERIVLRVAAARRDVYVATLTYQTALVLGASEQELDAELAGAGYNDAAATSEGVHAAAVGHYLCTLSSGLNVEPDFQPIAIPAEAGGFDAVAPDTTFPPTEAVAAAIAALRAALGDAAATNPSGDRVRRAAAAALEAFHEALGPAASPVSPEIAHLPAPVPRLRQESEKADPDRDAAAKAREGDLKAFEELVDRHGRRVYRTLVGILGNPEEARDAMQDTFLKAFQHLPGFEGRSKFSTWLLSIAANTGIQRLRERRIAASLDDPGINSGEGFRPRQVQAWTDDPERLYSQAETRGLVERGLMGLPRKYRVVLMLRDIEQVPTEEAAAALGLGVPALKARLLRGRLMLREALAPHFTARVNRKGTAS